MWLLAVAFIAILFSLFLFWMRRSSHRHVCFVGPHASGKTTALLKLADLDNKTVTSLRNFTVRLKNVDISEIVPNESAIDFTTRFSINPFDRFIFFIKNEEEMKFFPDCSVFDITFVMWFKDTESARSEQDVIYLDENPDELKSLILK